MKLIVGLGNPGREYEATRHNVGFMVLDYFQLHLNDSDGQPNNWRQENKFSGMALKTKWNKIDLLLFKPLTYMNLSGQAVVKIADYYRIGEEDMVVVHDDLDLSLGTLNIRRGGSSAGHHGIDSINNVLPNRNYLRVRVGVGKDRNKVVMTKQEGAKYVLTNFSASEQDLLAAIKKKCVEALFCCLEKTLTDCQNIYNQKISNNLPMED